MNNMPRFWVLPTIAFLIIFGLGFAVNKAHSAPDTRACVSNGEWSQLEKGQTKREVRALLDGKGAHQGDGMWWYKICDLPPRWEGRVITRYRGNKLSQAYHLSVKGGTFEKSFRKLG